MKQSQWIGVIVGVLCATMASTATAEGIGEVLIRVQESNFEPILRFITGGLFIVGIVFVGTAALNLKKMGQGQSAAGGVAFRNPVLNLLAGLFLIYLTVFVGIGGETLFEDPDANSTIQGEIDI